MIDTAFDFVASNARWFVAGSILGVFLTVPISLWFLSLVPSDYFSAQRRQVSASRHRGVQVLLWTAKNTVGAILIFVGIIMLFVPGQGVVTILLGLMLMNYPGKYRLERWLISRPRVLGGLNWIRVKLHRLPLDPPN